MQIMGKKDRLALLRNWQSIEQISYALVWAVLIILPLIFWDFNDPGQQRRIIGGWIRILPFLLIFLIHNFILLPRLLLRKHYLAYALVTLAVIVLVNYWFIFNETFHDLVFRWMENRGGMHEGIDRIREHEMHPGRSSGTGHRTGGGRYWRWHSPVYLIFTYNLLISLLVVTFNTVLKFTSGWLGQEQHRKEIEKEAVRSQLTALQNQVSPHFL
jgi:hypothetical protein